MLLIGFLNRAYSRVSTEGYLAFRTMSCVLCGSVGNIRLVTSFITSGMLLETPLASSLILRRSPPKLYEAV